jgi:hypothetical protein
LARYSQIEVGAGPNLVVVVDSVSVGLAGNLEVKPPPAGARAYQPASAGPALFDAAWVALAAVAVGPAPPDEVLSGGRARGCQGRAAEDDQEEAAH